MNPVHFPLPLVFAVRDQLRDMRYHIRRNAGRDHVQSADSATLHLPWPVARVADTIFSQVEAVAMTLLPKPMENTCTFPFAIQAIFGNTVSGARLFTPQIYFALKTLLRGFGVQNFLVAEQAIDDARVNLLRQHGSLVTTVLGEGKTSQAMAEADVVALCAAVAVALEGARAIKEFSLPERGDAPKNLFLSPNAYCSCVIGLASAMMSMRGKADAISPADVVVSADLAVDARFGRLMTALRSRDPQGSLAQEFAAILPYLR